METLDVEKTVSVLGTLKRFVDPSEFIPASNMIVCHRDYIVTTAVWGGAVYFGENSFVRSDEPIGISSMVVPDLLTFLESKNGRGAFQVEIGDNLVTFAVGRSKIKFGRGEPITPWDVTTLLSTELIELADTFLPALSELAFSVSDNAYKSQFGGVWYSECDHMLYASDNTRITSHPLNKPLGTGDNFFVPAVFLRKIPALSEVPCGIGINSGVCLFFYSEFAPFFVLRDVKMPSFSSTFQTVRSEALSSNVFFKLGLSEQQKASILGCRSLFYDDRGEASDVHLVREGDLLRYDIRHKESRTTRGFTDYLLLSEYSGDVDFRMDAEFFLDAVKRFDTFYVNPGKSIFVRSDDTVMEQLIAWKGHYDG
jgi:hypothetical protein